MSFCSPSSLWGARCSSYGSYEKPISKKPVSQSENKKSDKDAIISLDLEGVKRNLNIKLGWSKKRIGKSEKDYREFLLLARDASKLGIVPWDDDLDTFWHQHILDTEKYKKDCDLIFGYFLHHNPNIKNKTEHQKAINKTKRLVALRKSAKS